MAKSWLITITLSFIAVMARSAFFIVTPMWLDVFNTASDTNNTTLQNISLVSSATNHTQMPDVHKISVSFLLIFQWGVCTFVMGISLLVTKLIRPNAIGLLETSFPKLQFVVIGIAMGLSSLLFSYSAPGKRTAPYLTGIIVNLCIPIQFTLRFILLRKRTSAVQLLCALLILVAAFICLLPTIFPNLESSAAHKEDGGSSGFGCFFWPFCMVFSFVPYALSNTLQERSVQIQQHNALNSPDNQLTIDVQPSHRDESTQTTLSIKHMQQYATRMSDTESMQSTPSRDSSSCSLNSQDSQSTRGETFENSLDNAAMAKNNMQISNDKRINLIYFNFWCFLFVFMTVSLMFWVDLLPYFGTSPNADVFIERFKFDALCTVGLQDGCPIQATVFGWANATVALVVGMVIPALMRYSDGANFVAVVLTLRTPIVFIFWSLFLEQPFKWFPHIHLSTYLSIGAIALMLPAVVLYEIGDGLLEKCRRQISKIQDNTDVESLIHKTEIDGDSIASEATHSQNIITMDGA